MTRPVVPALALLLAAGVAGGCAGSTGRWTWPPNVPRPSAAGGPATTAVPPAAEGDAAMREGSRSGDAASLVDRAGAHARDGRPNAARELYERVIREYPSDPARPAALYGLGLLQSDPGGPLRDYRAAYLTFGRLLGEHPRSRWEPDARRWRAMLHELMAREEETLRLRGQIERLKRIEVELDRTR